MKGSVRRRSKGSWEICIDVGRDSTTCKRLRHFETIDGTKKDAQHRLAELLIGIEQGTYVKQKKHLTMAEYLRQWLAGHVASNLAPKTGESYTEQVEQYLIPRLGGVRLAEVRPNHIQDYIGWALSAGRKRQNTGLTRHSRNQIGDHRRPSSW